MKKLIILCLGSIFCGCNEDPETIRGTWQEKATKHRFEFKQDHRGFKAAGNFTWYMPEKDSYNSGSYDILTGGEIKLKYVETKPGGNSFVVSYDIELTYTLVLQKDSMVWKNKEAGKVEHEFVRVK
jgi:hypothetical protein